LSIQVEGPGGSVS